MMQGARPCLGQSRQWAMYRLSHLCALPSLPGHSPAFPATRPLPSRCTASPCTARRAPPQGFTHFPNVNPDAPKGGRLTLGQLGSFDSLNPLIIKGVSAVGVREYVYEALMVRGPDEAFSLYGHIAETHRRARRTGSSVTFQLRPEARFSDGKP